MESGSKEDGGGGKRVVLPCRCPRMSLAVALGLVTRLDIEIIRLRSRQADSPTSQRQLTAGLGSVD